MTRGTATKPRDASHSAQVIAKSSEGPAGANSGAEAVFQCVRQNGRNWLVGNQNRAGRPRNEPRLLPSTRPDDRPRATEPLGQELRDDGPAKLLGSHAPRLSFFLVSPSPTCHDKLRVAHSGISLAVVCLFSVFLACVTS